MADIVPAGQDRPVGLRDVLSGALAAVLDGGGRMRLGRPDRVLVVVVDGLGAEALAARAGHARTLASRLTRGSRITTGCPTTTAAALATLATGEDPGQHGIVGYAVLEPDRDRVVNQLHGFDDGELPPGWQRSTTVFERAVAAGVRAFAAGPRHYADSGFTAAVLRGAEYLGARTVEHRFDAALDAFAGGGRAIGYCYVPELDQMAHRDGWSSAAWTDALEAVDAAVAAAAARLRPGERMLVTADHGIVDVPPEQQVLVDGIPGLLDAVRHLAGEPRMLQLHLQPGASPARVADRWREALHRVADVRTRAEAIDAGWFGTVAPAVVPRIGDVLVAARSRAAFYDGRDGTGRGMIGQHGAWTDAERLVPLLAF
ncbi:MAG TPA: alkaline phosphatase family protein [Amnibacterium sp.]|nr:alkaline phosphatase family protein [Amnibacterium sp.]